ncbi:hypothetical protein OG874_00065 [Nocardia sp. NBC_00565]|uniref:hypothetical protein n=1 Tax=Nocardia sp. NBC_00565 TaxID=2975993 RepID=UPI002E804D38|nr:hypothetical protein [Nocardia sp. NBC_00565]WUC03648.1 hypothetical protein OG874_00065 [Nocardia sp. NBC_00565]
MRGWRRAPWQAYVDDLGRMPKGSTERGIADYITGPVGPDQIDVYLEQLMRENPENNRAHEIAWEIWTLMHGRVA